MDERSEQIKEWIQTHQMLTGAIVVGAFLCGYFLSIWLRRPADAWLSVAFVNEYANVGAGSPLYEDFVKADGFDDKRIVFDANYFFNLSNDKDFANQYFQKLVAYLEAGTVDAVVCTEENLSGIAQGGRVLDLRDEMTHGAFAEYEGRMYYYDSEEYGRLPVGISLAGSPYADALGYQDEVYLALSSKGTNLEQVERFLEFLLPQE